MVARARDPTPLLSSDPAAFGQSWEKESTYEDKVWKQRVGEAAWFLAVESGQPIGVVAVRHEADSPPENERELQAMWVTPPTSRKAGLAQRLAEAVIEWAKEDGADTVTLYVGPHQHRRPRRLREPRLHGYGRALADRRG